MYRSLHPVRLAHSSQKRSLLLAGSAVTHRVLVAFSKEDVAGRVWLLCRLLADDRCYCPEEQQDEDAIGEGFHRLSVSAFGLAPIGEAHANASPSLHQGSVSAKPHSYLVQEHCSAYFQ